MEAKEKAKELVEKYFSELRMPSDCDGCMQCVDRCGNMVSIAKQYALIAAEEILLTLYEFHYDSQSGAYEYWKEVKQEIEKI
jgi:ferredoxin